MDAKKATAHSPTIPQSISSDKVPLYIHLQHHDNDITCREIQYPYEQTYGPTFQEHLKGVKHRTIAYSRPPNIGDYVTQAKWHEAPEKSSTDLMGEYLQRLDP